jgi:hypothetical protein
MPLHRFADAHGYINIGPIPKGIPVNLLANVEPDFENIDVVFKVIDKWIKINAQKLSGEEARPELRKLVPDLLAANKCPDFIEDKGHYFGTDLPDNDKRALIEYLKTL